MIDWFRQAVSNAAYVPVVAAWFAALASTAAAFVTIVTAKIAANAATSVASRSAYINSVTAERSKWIDAFRRAMAEYMGMAERIISRRKDAKYENSSDWATDVQSLRTNLSSLRLRLNPRETKHKNLLVAARKVDQAARIHRWADVDLASEILARHGQWVLKFEWHRVKMEAASGAELKKLKVAKAELEADYLAFLAADGSLHPLDAIGAGESEIAISLLRSQMDIEAPSAAQDPVASA